MGAVAALAVDGGTGVIPRTAYSWVPWLLFNVGARGSWLGCGLMGKLLGPGGGAESS